MNYAKRSSEYLSVTEKQRWEKTEYYNLH